MTVASVLACTSKQLPTDQSSIAKLLKEAATSCVQQLLSAVLAAGPADRRFLTEHLLPLLKVAVTSCNPEAVAAILLAGARKGWKGAVIKEHMFVAAKKRCNSCFRLLVEAAHTAADVAELENTDTAAKVSRSAAAAAKKAATATAAKGEAAAAAAKEAAAAAAANKVAKVAAARRAAAAAAAAKDAAAAAAAKEAAAAAAATKAAAAANAIAVEQLSRKCFLRQALALAVAHKLQQAIVEWLLEKGLQAGGWKVADVTSAVASCIGLKRPKLLKLLLEGSEIAWQHGDLCVHVKAAAAKGKQSISLLQHLFAAAARSAAAGGGDSWRDEELCDALTDAAGLESCKEAVALLLSKAGGGWSNARLLPAAEGTIGAGLPKPVELRMVLGAAKGQRTAEQLSSLLQLAVKLQDISCMQEVLSIRGVQWSAATIAPAVEAAMGGSSKAQQLQLLLQVPLVLPWTGLQLEAFGQAAIRNAFPQGLQMVLGLPECARALTAG